MTGDDKVEVADAAANESPTENVDKIRDILFGGQMREYDRRFAEQEQRLLDELTKLKRTVEASLEEMRGTLQREVATVVETGAQERLESAQALTGVESSLDRISREFVVRFEQQQQGAKQQLGDLHEQLSVELHDRYDALGGRLDGVAQAMGKDKAGREELAALFKEFAERLASTK